jgi:SAM-dependent methyltransferase
LRTLAGAANIGAGETVGILSDLLERFFGGRASSVAEPLSNLSAFSWRSVPKDTGLLEWNETLNAKHGMAVLYAHPSSLVRFHERQRERLVLDRVHPGPEERVLEIGCEQGRLSSRLAKKTERLVCADIDMNMLIAARSRVGSGRAHFVVADAQRLPFRDGAGDIVVSSHTIEHLPDPAKGLEELARVTRRHMVLNVPNDRMVLLIKRFVFKILRAGGLFRGIAPGLAPGHLWVFCPELLRRLAAGRVELGGVSFNWPFFTNMFVVARPSPPARR